ncbi:MAG: hypothetical protein QXS85_05430 [Acidilobaceae archaeon]
MAGWRAACLSALSRIRVLQIRARMVAARLGRGEEARDYAVKLATLSEVLERAALKLETVVYTGVASESAGEALAVLAEALRKMRHALPPPLQHDALALWRELSELSQSMAPDSVIHLSSSTLEAEAERVLREAEEVARSRLSEQR